MESDKDSDVSPERLSDPGKSDEANLQRRNRRIRSRKRTKMTGTKEQETASG